MHKLLLEFVFVYQRDHAPTEQVVQVERERVKLYDSMNFIRNVLKIYFLALQDIRIQTVSDHNLSSQNIFQFLN